MASKFGEGWRKGCPDCAAMPEDQTIRHDPSCPIWVGVERAVEDDRLWFEWHPGHRQFTRRATHAERVEMEINLGAPLYGDMVRVLQPTPGGPRSGEFQTSRRGRGVMTLDGLA